MFSQIKWFQFFFLSLIISFSAQSYSSIENYFLNPTLKNANSRTKEVYFTIKTEVPGIFGNTEKELFFKMTITVQRNDAIALMVSSFSDSTYSSDKIEGVYRLSGSSSNGARDRVLLGVLSYLFFGRSLELYKTYPNSFGSEKQNEDLLLGPTKEQVLNSTEVRLFKKAHQRDSVDGNLGKHGVVGKYLSSQASAKGIGFSKAKGDLVKGLYFNKVIKDVLFGNFAVSVNTSDHKIQRIKSDDFEILFDNLNQVNENYPKEILFKSDNKRSLLRIDQVKSFSKKIVDINQIYSDFLKLKIPSLNLTEMLW